MILLGTVLSISDNSGALKAKCIRLYQHTKLAKSGDIILVVLKAVKPNRKVKKGQVFKAIVVRSTVKVGYLGGHSIYCDSNSVILLKKNGDILGSRFRGPIVSSVSNNSLLKPLNLTGFFY